MMHSGVAGAVWASILATFEWHPEYLATSGRVCSEGNRMIDQTGSVVLVDHVAKAKHPAEPSEPKFGFTLDGFD